MKLHIFNPEHDISLAQNNPNQIPSRAALQIRNDLDFIPYIWAAQGDVVLVNDVMKAYEAVEKLRLKDKNVSFIDADILEKYSTLGMGLRNKGELKTFRYISDSFAFKQAII